MGNSEAEATSKSDKASPLHQQQIAIHPYPDWAAMQPYYGSGVGLPHAYYASAVIPGQPYPYIWGPQSFMPPFGTPYPAIYPHTAYMHPSASHSSQSQAQGNGTSSATSEAAMSNLAINGIPAKSPVENKEDSVPKKLKGIDGLAVSLINENVKNTEGSEDKLLLGREGDTEGSTDGSGGNKRQKRNSAAEVPTDGKNGKVDTQSSSEENSTKITLSVPLPHSNITGEAVATPVLNSAPALDLRVSTSGTVTPVKTPTLPSTALVPKALNQDHWLQDDREIKRERRKQSNRESARRSRLRKQAETEELALKVESFTSENITLRSEISKLSEMLGKLRQENSALRDKLKNPEGEECMGNASTIKLESQEVHLITLGNLSTEANGSSMTTDRNKKQADQSPRLKLHQLLEPGPKSDAVAAS